MYVKKNMCKILDSVKKIIYSAKIDAGNYITHRTFVRAIERYSPTHINR
jgi:hypothetical protein